MGSSGSAVDVQQEIRRRPWFDHSGGRLGAHAVSLGDLEDRTRGPELVRGAHDALALRLDGKPAAAKTITRKRAILYNAMEQGAVCYCLRRQS